MILFENVFRKENKDSENNKLKIRIPDFASFLYGIVETVIKHIYAFQDFKHTRFPLGPL